MREHLGLLISFGSATLVGARILAVSGFDRETAYVVLNSQSTSAVVLGTLLPLVALIPALLACLGALLQPADHYNPWAFLRWFALLAFGSLLTPWPLALAMCALLAVAVVLLVIRRYRSRRRLRERRPRSEREKQDRAASALRTDRRLRAALYVLLAVQTLGAAFSSAPWLPRETFSTSGGTEVVVDGYLLTAEDDELLVLRHSPRIVVRVPASADREFCSQNPGVSGAILPGLFEARPAIGLLTDIDRYPYCPRND